MIIMDYALQLANTASNNRQDADGLSSQSSLAFSSIHWYHLPCSPGREQNLPYLRRNSVGGFPILNRVKDSEPGISRVRK